MALIVLDTDVVSRHRAGRLPAGAARQVAANDRRPRPLNDTWIAACCIESRRALLTLNRRDFADFAEHDGLVLLGA